MTYEELTAVLDDYAVGLSNGFVHKNSVFGVAKALRAVVELHKPFMFHDSPEKTTSVCRHCQLGVVGDVYPCETIYAIEKELQ